jgi:serine/threonine-protein kinase
VEELRTVIGAVLASKYRVDAVLGAGGMGVVLAATHLQLHEQVAIKLLRAETATRPDAVERFLREARVAMKLRGEHVVRVLDVGTLDDGAPFIAMECLRGSDLGAVLRVEGRLPHRTAVDYVLQACEAIAEAHGLGVIHRDLKPANLFLTRRVDGSPCVKVLDFGISKIGGMPQEPTDPLAATAQDPDAPESRRSARRVPRAAPLQAMTGTSALLGSPRYMAPEQLRSPRDVDVRADIWALGTILFELVAGKPPFEGDTLEEVRAAVTERRAPALTNVPAGLQRAVHACLAKSPVDRCSSVPDLVEALAPFASPEGAESVRRVRRMARASWPVGAASLPPADAAGGRTNDAVVGDTGRPIRRASVAVAIVALCLGGATIAIRTRSLHRADIAATPAVTAGPLAPSTPPPAAAPSEAPSQASSPDPMAIEAASAALVPPRAAIIVRRPTHPAPAQAAPSDSPPAAPLASGAAAAARPSTDPLKLDAGFLFLDRK